MKKRISNMLYPHHLSDNRRSTHTHVVGQPGTGKSTALESWVMQDIQAGKGLCVIDPHGDLFRHLLFRIAALPREIWQRVVIIDPLDSTWSVPINPLVRTPGIPITRSAWFLTDIILKIWKIEPTRAPRMTWLTVNAFIALMELGLSLLDLQPFLLNASYRDSLVKSIQCEMTRNYFTNEYPRTTSASNNWSASFLNKIGHWCSIRMCS